MRCPRPEDDPDRKRRRERLHSEFPSTGRSGPLPATRTDAGRRISKRRIVRRSWPVVAYSLSSQMHGSGSTQNFTPDHGRPKTDGDDPLAPDFTYSPIVCKRKKQGNQSRLMRLQRGRPRGRTLQNQTNAKFTNHARTLPSGRCSGHAIGSVPTTSWIVTESSHDDNV